MTHRVASKAAADLDDIWFYVADESGSTEVANRLIDSISNRFYILGNFPHLGCARDEDFGPGMRSHPGGEYGIVYCIEHGEVLILRVVHGRRDLEPLFGE